MIPRLISGIDAVKISSAADRIREFVPGAHVSLYVADQDERRSRMTLNFMWRDRVNFVCGNTGQEIQDATEAFDFLSFRGQLDESQETEDEE
jgi:hypothetical protein